MILISTFLKLILIPGFLWAHEITLIGKVPAQYLKRDFNHQKVQRDPSLSVLAVVIMEDRVIKEISDISRIDYRQVLQTLNQRESKVIELKNNSGGFDIIYPGLIDLHGHNKQNMLPTWTSAAGRFANRYEWRYKSQEYQKVQSQNMNPWSRNLLGEVAAYRWSELHAMVLGTTYLQGHKLYDLGFTIHSVEDPNAFISQRDRVRSVGDIIDPFKWSFLWNVLRPIMSELGCEHNYSCYKKSLSSFLKKNCTLTPLSRQQIENQISAKSIEAQVPEFVVEQVDHPLSIQWLLEAKDHLAKACPIKNTQEMTTFLSLSHGNLPHTEIVERNAYLDQQNASAIITHLSEGTSWDPMSWLEFKLLKLAGLARDGMNIIHGNALEKEDFQYMAQQNMGLVWSPYSNFLLYGESVDIETAIESGVLIALGSDWTPTGSKSVLEELKVASYYIDREGLKISDTDLYNMVTENPARIIKHFGYENPQERGIGTLEVGALASLIVVKEKNSHPHTNLVRFAQAQDINLVVIDGEPIYGNRRLMEEYDSQRESEVISGRLFQLTLENDRSSFPATFARDRLDELGLGVAEYAARIELGYSTQCQFEEDKILFKKQSVDYPLLLQESYMKTGLNLDTYEGITKFIGVALLSQNHNISFDGQSIVASDWALKEMPPLFSCEDHNYLEALSAMVNPQKQNTLSRMNKEREDNRIEAGLFTSITFSEDPLQRKINYSIPYELTVLYQFLPSLEQGISSEIFEPIIDIKVKPEWLKKY